MQYYAFRDAGAVCVLSKAQLKPLQLRHHMQQRNQQQAVCRLESYELVHLTSPSAAQWPSSPADTTYLTPSSRLIVNEDPETAVFTVWLLKCAWKHLFSLF